VYPHGSFPLKTGLGPKLYHLHIDDVRAVDWREHFLPGTGIIDWPRLFTKLSRARYDGLFAAEILYFGGADDHGPDYKRVFTQRPPDGVPAIELQKMREFLRGAFSR
jgi:sugar phosphate isomerase/epimerase